MLCVRKVCLKLRIFLEGNPIYIYNNAIKNTSYMQSFTIEKNL